MLKLRISGAVHLLPLYAFLLCTGKALFVTEFFFFVEKMAETDREQVISLLRACIISVKGGVPVKNLNRKLYLHHQSPFLYISLKIRAVRFLLFCIEYGQEMPKK